jgi:hypothetical protein
MPMWVFQYAVIFLLIVIILALNDIRNAIHEANEKNDDL